MNVIKSVEMGDTVGPSLRGPQALTGHNWVVQPCQQGQASCAVSPELAENMVEQLALHVQ